MKSLVKTALHAIGFDIRRLPESDRAVKKKSPYEWCMTALLSATDPLHIVQVGANDGAINDPIYEFAREHPARTRLILVEPQRTLLPFLSQNYAFHDNASVFNGVIGSGDAMTLFAVRQELWGKLTQPAYATGWPLYRAPTGVTSTNKAHVERFLEKYLPAGVSRVDSIEAFTVECVKLEGLLARFSFPEQIDVLQIDAEGADDEVIYASNVPQTRPRIINFEMGSLGESRMNALKTHLHGLGYSLHPQADDMMAIRTQAS